MSKLLPLPGVPLIAVFSALMLLTATPASSIEPEPAPPVESPSVLLFPDVKELFGFETEEPVPQDASASDERDRSETVEVTPPSTTPSALTVIGLSESDFSIEAPKLPTPKQLWTQQETAVKQLFDPVPQG